MTAPPPQPLRSHGLTIFLTVAATVMALGAVGSVVPLSPFDQLSHGAGERDADSLTLEQTPVERWSADADAIVPGGSFVRPDAGSMYYLLPGTIEVDGLVITAVVPNDPDRDATLVAFDGDGNRQWSTVWSRPDLHGHAIDVTGDGLTAASRTSVLFLGAAGLSNSGLSGTGLPDPKATGQSATGQSGTELTRCGRPPEVTPVEYRADQDGLMVRTRVRAQCPGGDIVSTDALRVTLFDASSPAASALFDMSSAPLYLPPTTDDRSVTVDFLFEPGSFTRMPNSLGNTDISGSTVAVPTLGQVVECVDEGTSHGPTSASASQVGSTVSAPVRSDRPATPTNVDPDQLALDALRAQARADLPYVFDRLEDRWVVQLSSKYPGLQAPDITGPDVTWTNRAILDQHLRLRLQYPEARLVWSDDWSTFTMTGWWITVVGENFGDADAANRWCDDRGIPTDECFAKVVSDNCGPEGTTKYRR